MLDETISKIQARIDSSAAFDDAQRAELLKLLSQLKAEVGALSQTHQQQAQNITSFFENSARQATGKPRGPESAEQANSGLEASVEGIEESHPKVVALVNRIASMLANMGI
jgi:hypothetical protein